MSSRLVRHDRFYVCASPAGACTLVARPGAFDGRKAFSDFVLFVYEAMSVSGGGAGGNPRQTGALPSSTRCAEPGWRLTSCYALRQDGLRGAGSRVIREYRDERRKAAALIDRSR